MSRQLARHAPDAASVSPSGTRAPLSVSGPTSRLAAPDARDASLPDHARTPGAPCSARAPFRRTLCVPRTLPDHVRTLRL